MRKMRADSTWNGLTPGQLELLDEWLFEERLGYADALVRVEKEFGLQASLASMGRYYRSRSKYWQLMDLITAQRMAWEVNDLAVSTDDLRKATMKLLAKTVLKLAVEQPEQLEQLVSLTKLLLESESNGIRRSKVKLAEQYFHYEATAAIEKDLPYFKAYVDAIAADTSLSHDEKLKKIKAAFVCLDPYKSRKVEPDESKNGN
jgi:hypothetical protein